MNMHSGRHLTKRRKNGFDSNEKESEKKKKKGREVTNDLGNWDSHRLKGNKKQTILISVSC